VDNVGVIFEDLHQANYALQGDLGVQVAADGRVWVCINGIAFLRFSPHPNGKMAPDPAA